METIRLPFPDAAFDLAVSMLTLHEMPHCKRVDVLAEMARVTTVDGQLLLIDFHPGFLRFPKGCGIKPLILMIERMHGRERFRNDRDFIAQGGTAAPARRQPTDDRPHANRQRRQPGTLSPPQNGGKVIAVVSANGYQTGTQVPGIKFRVSGKAAQAMN